MSTDTRRPHRPGRGDLRLTFALLLAIATTLIPLTRVLAPGPWTTRTLMMCAAVLILGAVLRRFRTPALAVSGIELAAWVGAVTAIAFPGLGLFAVIPTTEVIHAVPPLLQRVSSEIMLGTAPVTPSPELTALIVAAMGLVTILLDHVVLTARMPLLAAVVLVAIWLIAALAVPAPVNVFAFVLLAAALLLLLRAETRTRERAAGRGGRGVSVVAAAMGAVAVIVAVVATPSLPVPRTAGAGFGLTSIDASLDLGADLRARSDTPVLTYVSDAPSAPNLRVATLSSFDGDVWAPDRLRSVPLDEPGSLEAVPVTPDIRVTEYRTDVSVTALSSAYLPVPFPAVEVTGLDGAWQAVPYNRTVLSSRDNAQGEDYEVVSHVPRPTLEQAQAADAALAGSSIDLVALPVDTPAVIAETARQVTAGAATDYERLIALQSWFRGSSFSYSLTAPVSGDFDGTSTQAVAEFLQVREGYCVHFAGAFALMARSLSMPSRVVVGFLPGAPTGDSVDGKSVLEATTSQLHAWPEVHFAGIGWIGFEPTKNLGTPTRFDPAASDLPGGGVDVGPNASEEAVPDPTEQERRDTGDVPPDAGRSPDATSGIDLRPFLLTVAGVVVVAAIPGLAGWMRRRILLRRARAGSVAAAWRFVQDAAIDAGADAPASESPRAFGVRLIDAGAPTDETERLVSAIERTSYARADQTGVDVAAEASAVRAGLRAASHRSRVLQTVAPRSLLVRPGAVAAPVETE